MTHSTVAFFSLHSSNLPKLEKEDGQCGELLSYLVVVLE
jgi:hypothetical protein